MAHEVMHAWFAKVESRHLQIWRLESVAKNERGENFTRCRQIWHRKSQRLPITDSVKSGLHDHKNTYDDEDTRGRRRGGVPPAGNPGRRCFPATLARFPYRPPVADGATEWRRARHDERIWEGRSGEQKGDEKKLLVACVDSGTICTVAETLTQ